jgi:hypothetical protein
LRIKRCLKTWSVKGGIGLKHGSLFPSHYLERYKFKVLIIWTYLLLIIRSFASRMVYWLWLVWTCEYVMSTLQDWAINAQSHFLAMGTWSCWWPYWVGGNQWIISSRELSSLLGDTLSMVKCFWINSFTLIQLSQLY